MTQLPQRLIDGPSDAALTLLLAHGAGAPMDSPFMAAIAAGLADRGWRVVRFEFPYMSQQRLTGTRRPPDRLPVLLAAFREQLTLEVGRSLVIGGKSLGGRVASLLAVEPAGGSDLRGCLCLGYPFHPPGKPQQLRSDHLGQLAIPALILQGERDPFGRRTEVEGYDLGQEVSIGWLKAGDHSFKPARSSGLTQEENWANAAAQADHWLQGLTPVPPAVDIAAHRS